MKAFIRCILVLMLLSAAISSIHAEQSLAIFSKDQISDYFKKWLLTYDVREMVRVGGVDIAISLVQEFYCLNAFEPVWCTKQGPNAQARIFLAALQQVAEDGLQPNDYHLREIQALIAKMRGLMTRAQGNIDPHDLAVFDVLMTDAFFLYAIHVNRGRVDPKTIEKNLPKLADNNYWPGFLKQGVTSPAALQQALQDVIPRDPGYRRMRQALAFYRGLQTRLQGLAYPYEKPLKVGDRQPRLLPVLRVMLNAYGDLPFATCLDPALFTPDVESAVKLFQRRHGLTESGIVDEKTAAWLNQPIAASIDKLVYNLERWRWLALVPEQQYIKVNIPAFQLEVIEEGKAVLNMRVVVGRGYNRTPVFSNKVRFVVLNPSWDIPPNILVTEKVPLIRNQPDYFEKYRVEVIKGWDDRARVIDPKTVDWKAVRLKEFYTTYRFRQLAGPANPLGKVKFVFPNDYNVYLHDTQQKKLFAEDVRYFSYGCIRLEKPVDLAAYCLRNEPFWTRPRVDAALAGKLEQKIKLTKPITIYILYYTAWVDEQGAVNFRQDFYGRDQELDRALRRTAIATSPTP